MLYNEGFFDSDELLSEDFASDLDNIWGEKNTSKQKREKRQKVESRRRVEEILAQRRYKELYSDPFEEFEC